MKHRAQVIIHPNSKDIQKVSRGSESQGNKKPGPKRIRLAFLGVILIFVLLAFSRAAWVSYQLDLELQTYQSILDELKEEQFVLRDEIALTTDPNYVEKVARERLGLVKPGERVIIPALPGDILPLVQPAEGEIQH